MLHDEPLTPAPKGDGFAPLRAVCRQLGAEWRELTRMASHLDAGSSAEILRLLSFLGERLTDQARQAAALSELPEANLRQLEKLDRRLADLQEEFRIVRATLDGRVSNSSRSTPHTIHQETRSMSRKPWLFDPDDVPELENYSDPEDMKDDNWLDWESDSGGDDGSFDESVELGQSRYRRSREDLHRSRHRRRRERSHRAL